MIFKIYTKGHILEEQSTKDTEKRRRITTNIELNDLRKINCLRKSEDSVEKFGSLPSPVILLKLLRSVTYTVCHDLIQITS